MIIFHAASTIHFINGAVLSGNIPLIDLITKVWFYCQINKLFKRNINKCGRT